MDSGSTLKQLFLHQSRNLENSWLPFRGREQEPVYSAPAGTVIPAPPSKTNEPLFVLCSPLFSSAHGTPALACAIPAVHTNTVLGWVTPRAVSVLLLPVSRKAWSGETNSVQCSGGICAAGPNTGFRLLRKNQVLGDLEK